MRNAALATRVGYSAYVGFVSGGKRFRARWQVLILATSRESNAVDFARSNGRYLRI
jgi:hypothetical protein